MTTTRWLKPPVYGLTVWEGRCPSWISRAGGAERTPVSCPSQLAAFPLQPPHSHRTWGEDMGTFGEP